MSETKHEHHRHDHECGRECECANCHGSEYRNENPPPKVHAALNEEPEIFSESYELTFTQESSTLPLQEALLHWGGEILRWVKNKHGFVGHIKGFSEGTEYFWFSSTGKAINTKSSSGWSAGMDKKFTINAAAIIFGTPKEELAEYARQCLERSIANKCPDSTLVRK
ncbi:MAG: hypothetical protein AAGU16_11925 [Desulfitobacterium hafniense]